MNRIIHLTRERCVGYLHTAVHVVKHLKHSVFVNSNIVNRNGGYS